MKTLFVIILIVLSFTAGLHLGFLGAVHQARQWAYEEAVRIHEYSPDSEDLNLTSFNTVESSDDLRNYQVRMKLAGRSQTLLSFYSCDFNLNASVMNLFKKN